MIVQTWNLQLELQLLYHIIDALFPYLQETLYMLKFTKFQARYFFITKMQTISRTKESSLWLGVMQDEGKENP